jgi:hypothetical protein
MAPWILKLYFGDKLYFAPRLSLNVGFINPQFNGELLPRLIPKTKINLFARTEASKVKISNFRFDECYLDVSSNT